jgi:hypothetical protein
MEVTDHLPRLPAAVDRDAVAVLDSIQFGHLLGSEKHLRPDLGGFFIKGVEGIKVPLGNNQEMNGRFRVNVFDHCEIFIFMDDIAG